MQNSGSVASFRKLTPEMMVSQRLAMANDIVETTKSEVAMALKKAAPALGVDGTTYHILDILIGLTAADDWQTNHRPLVAISNEKLAEYVCRSKRTVIRCLKRLVEAGIIAYRDSPTGRRYIHRGEFRQGRLGEIERGYGFDFSPARQRVHELKAIGAQFAARLKAQKDARRSVNRLLRAIEDMASLAAREGIGFSDVQEAVSALNERAMDIVTRAEVLQNLYEMAVAAFAPTEEETQQIDVPVLGEMACAGDINGIPYNNTNPQSLKRSNRTRRSANADPSNSSDPKQVGIKPALERKQDRNFSASSNPQHQEGALENISIGLLKSALSNLQDSLGFEFSCWGDLLKVSGDIALLIGLSQSGFEHAQGKVGRYVAAAVLATTAEKALRDPLLISSPGGYFRACVDRAVDGELALHKSLFGLAQAR
ncbi:plasmid replication protein RepC [Pseudovibrio sp. Tun.PSC04-5.I4]|uniref:plasmid replication protein RepC n=1 Tax=Pseudovibrio sp. Tun.PSC04-5.I4 TaxID=1798213 RepID=UPI00088D0C8D|nr:plasmid replication protein RepC [Pseudovibrio sp. Tun.PSC04-5.I4]SDQ31130.1 replication initiation protein RepC [Pseudovibrio sp. Tun.PSC04-5.I4]SDQ33996.1 replication initiation protein RepC [Pseudovibrio sp. Tun.PSC04-5.I4]